MISVRHGSATVTLPSDTEIRITRRFDAPAGLVFEAWTTPDLVRRWWGSEEMPITVCEIDLRVGGAWRYVTRGRDGEELGWHGTFLEIEPARRIVSTECFEGFPEAETVNTLTLVQDGGVTTLEVLVRHSRPEYRDGHLESGMEGGLQQTFDRLADLVAHHDIEQQQTLTDQEHHHD
jgi:uncharacterized protein YndB with AHSA1/START domain